MACRPRLPVRPTAMGCTATTRPNPAGATDMVAAREPAQTGIGTAGPAAAGSWSGWTARARLLADVAIAFALFGLAAVGLLRAAETVPFHGDESEWINAGRYFRYIFLDHDVTSQVWRPSWLN